MCDWLFDVVVKREVRRIETVVNEHIYSNNTFNNEWHVGSSSIVLSYVYGTSLL